MGLAEDLLSQASHLAELDQRRPKQANLRRAVSASYYALFHLLVAEAVQKMVPVQPRGLMSKASRSFQHGEMREVCNRFRTATEPAWLTALIGSNISPDLKEGARFFIELQDARHSADYDPGFRLSRTGALDLVRSAEEAFRSWAKVRGHTEGNVFLTALVFGKRWDR